MDTLIKEIVDDLKLELNSTVDFDEGVLISKVKNAVREVRDARNYPESYTELMIARDIARYHSVIYKLALYDYNMIGAEYETSHSENNIDRTWVDRKKMLSGVVPFASIL